MPTYGVDPVTGLPKTQKNRRYLQPNFQTSGYEEPQPQPTVGTSPLPQITIPGYQPNYEELINNYAPFSQLKNDLSAQGVQDASQRGALTQRALIAFGEVPDFTQAGASLGLDSGFLGEDVTDQTRELARQNTAEGLSQVAKLNEQHLRNVQLLKNMLAARGALRSGASGVLLGQEAQGFKRAQSDARTQLIDYLSEYQRGYLEGQRRRQAEQNQGLYAATQDIASDPRYQPTPDQTADLVPGSTALYATPEEQYYADLGNGSAPAPVQDPYGTGFVEVGGQSSNGQPVASGSLSLPKLRAQILQMHEQGMSWPKIKATAVWRQFIAAGGS